MMLRAFQPGLLILIALMTKTIAWLRSIAMISPTEQYTYRKRMAMWTLKANSKR